MKRLLRNILAITGSDIARRLLGFLTVAYLARTISVAEFGLINIGFTVLAYALMLSSAGLTSYGVRAIASGKPPTIVRPILTLRVLLSLAVVGAIVLIARFAIADELTAQIVMLFSLSTLANALLVDWYFQGRERMGIVGLVRFLAALVYSFIIVVSVKSSSNLLVVAFAVIASDTLAAGALLIAYRRENRSLGIRFSLSGIDAIARSAIALGLGGLLGNLSTNLAPVLLGVMKDLHEVGMYSAASKMVFFLLMFDRLIGTLLLPASSRLHAVSVSSLAQHLTVALKWIVVLGLPLCIGGSLLAGDLVSMVFGEQYEPAALPFAILVWFCIATMLHTVFTSGMIALGLERRYGRIMAISIGLYALTVCIGIWWLGSLGAACAMVFSEIVTLVLMRRELGKSLNISLPQGLVETFVSAMIMGITMWVVPPIHVAVTLCFGCAVYAVVIYMTEAVSRDEISSLIRRVA